MYARNRLVVAALAALAFAAGCAVYLIARPASVFSIGSASVYLPWTAAAPSFLHTLCFGSLCALAAQSRAQLLWLAAGWGAIELIAELMQHPDAPLTLTVYQRGSTFDPFDIGAVIVATALVVACAPRTAAAQ